MSIWKRLFGTTPKPQISAPENGKTMPSSTAHDPHVHTGIEMRAHKGRLVYFRQTRSFRDDL